MASLTVEEIDDILYLARTNEAAELAGYVQELCTSHGSTPGAILAAAVDTATANTVLHYAGANGHIDILTLVQSSMLSETPSTSRSKLDSLLNAPNASQNTALHWAALNGQLPFVRALLGLGADASLTNAAGHDAVFEAEINGKTEVAEWLLKEAVGLETAVGLDGDFGADMDEGGKEEAQESEKREDVTGAEGVCETKAAGDEELRTKLEGMDVGKEKENKLD